MLAVAAVSLVTREWLCAAVWVTKRWYLIDRKQPWLL